MIPGILFAQPSTSVVPTTPTLPPPPSQKQQTQPAAAATKTTTVDQTPTEQSPVARGEVSIESNLYPHPGIYFKKGGSWVGDDNLFNLDRNIEIIVEIERTKGVTDLDSNHIKELIQNIFKKSTISPRNTGDQPPYPYYHILIMIAPIQKGYAVYCSGRLFESVALDRSHLDKDVYYQAITWEKQALLVIPSDKLRDDVDKAVSDITNSFVERYRHFEDLKLRQAAEQH